LDFVEFSIEEIENIYKQIDIEIEKLPTQCREVFPKERIKYKEIADQLNIRKDRRKTYVNCPKKKRKKLNYSSNILYLFLTNLT
jgi:hypothetical protein